jgi:hypothetical protein
MITSLRQLDELLRGQITSPQSLAEGRLKLSLRLFVPLAVLLGTTFGFFMGWYAISLYWGGTTPEPQRLWQVLASTVKLPLLFLATLIVTFPSLYVFNALFGCRAGFVDTLRLLVGAVTVNLAVAASLGPILGFFTLSTTSYPFMVLLNVVLLAIAGFVALGFLLQTLRRLAPPTLEVARPEPRPEPKPESPPVEPMHDSADLDPREIGVVCEPMVREPVGPLDKPPASPQTQAFGQARTVFKIWVLIYALVGAQMGWILRPFIGSPDLPFQWFRPRSGNFFQAVMTSLQNLLGLN